MASDPTQGFIFNHTMLRIKDPKLTLPFYEKIFGMRLIEKVDMPEGEFTLYFLGRTEGETFPQDPAERLAYRYQKQGLLEFTHNWGTEKDKNFSYHNGNDEPQGYGHICFTVPNLEETVAWMDQNNVTFQKRPEDGRMKEIAFVRDPDGYWIELIGRN